jgi:nucleotide-binding universal stress UspA family protein
MEGLAEHTRSLATTAVLRVLLATDLSAASEQAANVAIKVALEHGAQLLVLSVVDPGRLRLPGGRFLRRVDQERARTEAGAQVIVRRARMAGARATFLVWEGDPADTILSASESERADIIVLGSHERGRLGRLVLGSISSRVSDEARCAVLIVGHDADPVGPDTTPDVNAPSRGAIRGWPT